MQLREAKTLRVFNHHDGRFGHIDAHLNHRSRNQDRNFARLKTGHDGILVRRLHPPMDEPHLVAEFCLQRSCPIFSGGNVQVFGLFHQWTHPVSPRTASNSATDPIDHLVEARVWQPPRINRLAPRGFFGQSGYIHIPVDR